ncbi:hypothetical protein [Halorubrum aethiopicum]|uniref:hypothetical protein n=1 Tax=Halorubrum aethiopicum TaxID=1758255 RepID=UPI0008316B66|nr:hypothetical protein [Halorubrum aethiopicum]
MERKVAEVRGTAVAELPGSLYNVLHETDEEEEKTVQLGGSLYGSSDQSDGRSVVRHSGDGFDVIVAEQYYLRTNSDLQATIVIEQKDTNQASVTVIAGGGATGLGPLSWDLGSESAQTDTLVSLLEDVCDQLGLSLNPDER